MSLDSPKPIIPAEPKPTGKKTAWWMLYVSMAFAGVFLLADALGYAPLQKTTAKLGVALIYSTFVLLIGRGRPIGYVAAALIWAAVIATWVW